MSYCLILIFSILINYFLVKQIYQKEKTKKSWLITGLVFNITVILIEVIKESRIEKIKSKLEVGSSSAHFEFLKDEVTENLDEEIKKLPYERMHTRKTRTEYDIEMMLETGYCSGIDNYVRYLNNREPGEQPATLLDYFPDDFLLVMDESHMMVPQVRGMYNGDRKRKEVLVEHGFRLPSAMDNRPLRWEEFVERIVERTPVPVVPLGLRGMWGSIFSYSGGKVLGRLPRRIPYPVRVMFGEPLPARTSAFQFKGSDHDIREIGRKLGVKTVLEGSVRTAGKRLRVTAQLVGVGDGSTLWSERYDRQMADVFDIQDEIVASIVEALVPALLGEATCAVTRPTIAT